MPIDAAADPQETAYFVGVTSEGYKLSVRLGPARFGGPIEPFPMGLMKTPPSFDGPLVYPVSAAVFREWQADDQDVEFPCTGHCDPDARTDGECDCPLRWSEQLRAHATPSPPRPAVPDTSTADRIETAAQVLHSRRHRAGYGQVCTPCRQDAAAVAAVLLDARGPDDSRGSA